MNDKFNSDEFKIKKPRKTRSDKELGDATIMPVTNGYIVQSSYAKGECFVFPDIDKAFDFIKTRLCPTGEQSEFLSKV